MCKRPSQAKDADNYIFHYEVVELESGFLAVAQPNN
jgi:hypothetical protein